MYLMINDAAGGYVDILQISIFYLSFLSYWPSFFLLFMYSVPRVRFNGNEKKKKRKKEKKKKRKKEKKKKRRGFLLGSAPYGHASFAVFRGDPASLIPPLNPKIPLVSLASGFRTALFCSRRLTQTSEDNPIRRAKFGHHGH